ncbi:similar to Saccharomyces cerevisiae YNL212W VID27 Cytoplasmic protein of unknown function [Maudiozyma saulgeensis]|uniref:Vacuolar import and degradation protein 27 n=1 Tax=Maudiozyma saulgeensis TaxID=1789683 RepID=A0A1X7R2R5_9SACH|nr:similar to Saccharomyces cerevisiae YNL212W VID27 Cytoplasmic protein of unknown function [Kazachstania saulgeensis]
MNLIKKFMDQGNKSDLMTLPSGEFDLLRSKRSPRSSLECIYSDASLSIRDAGKYRYELIVKKVSEDGDTILGEDDEDFSDDTRSVLSVQSKKKEEEWAFAFSKDLGFLKTWTKNGDVAFVWKNLNGDEPGEKVQFVLSHEVQHHDIERFLDAIYCCYYETTYHRPSLSASPEAMKEIELICNTAGIVSEDYDNSGDRENITSIDRDNDSDNEEFQDANDSVRAIHNTRMNKSIKPKRAPSPPQNAPSGKQLLLLNADLYLFDPMAEKFLKQESLLKISIIDVGSYNYWLSIEGKDNRLGTDISSNINPTFNSSKKSFVFNYTFENITLSYMLGFVDVKDFKKFRATWTETVWMSLNRDDWNKLPAVEKEYINDPAEALTQQLDEILHIDGNKERNLESAIDSSSSEDEDDDDSEYSSTILSSTSFGDSNRSALSGKNSKAGNQSLTVSSKNNRSYVIRENKIGVFKTGDDLEFVTTIKDVSDLKGDSFTPLTPMMYMEDSSMIISDSSNRNKLYKMDLNRGSIVEEWGTGDKDVVQYGPTKKFDQLTAEQTFVGVSPNGMFKVDPRINSENKIVVDQSKEYKTKCNFSSISTTENGYIAVGSEKGDIKLYDRLGIRAKTAIPSLGEAIRYICSSSDGRWLLATCDNMLMLMDLTVKTGKNQGSVAFLKSFPAAENAKTYILKISPEHASYMMTYMKKPIVFTKAYFNTGIGKTEDSILTSTGPFAITWSIKSITQNADKPYSVKRYESDVVEDNFEFGSNKKVIVALKDDVSMAKIRSFKKPNKNILIPKETINEFYQ